MADKTINDYTAAVSIDASNDYYLIEQSGVYKRINRNVGLGLASAPLGITDVQSPQNKTFDNSNSITVKDGNLTIQNSSSTTKQAIFSASSITAGQTRTFTFPDLSGTLVTASGSQTLTNKTLTSPTISGGSIDNTTITVDSISGHTSGTLVTIANLQISNGVLNSSNAVTSTSIAAGAVQPQALVSGTGSGWGWQSYTPTWTNISTGNGTVTANYIQIGKTVFYRIVFTLGSTSTVTGTPTFTLPVQARSYNEVTGATYIGEVEMDNASVPVMGKVFKIGAATTATIVIIGVSATYATQVQINSTTPFTWGTGNALNIQGFYEAL